MSESDQPTKGKLMVVGYKLQPTTGGDNYIKIDHFGGEWTEEVLDSLALRWNACDGLSDEQLQSLQTNPIVRMSIEKCLEQGKEIDTLKSAIAQLQDKNDNLEARRMVVIEAARVRVKGVNALSDRESISMTDHAVDGVWQLVQGALEKEPIDSVQWQMLRSMLVGRWDEDYRSTIAALESEKAVMLEALHRSDRLHELYKEKGSLESIVHSDGNYTQEQLDRLIWLGEEIIRTESNIAAAIGGKKS